jgi:hypothetical protein
LRDAPFDFSTLDANGCLVLACCSETVPRPLQGGSRLPLFALMLHRAGTSLVQLRSRCLELTRHGGQPIAPLRFLSLQFLCVARQCCLLTYEGAQGLGDPLPGLFELAYGRSLLLQLRASVLFGGGSQIQLRLDRALCSLG